MLVVGVNVITFLAVLVREAVFLGYFALRPPSLSVLLFAYVVSFFPNVAFGHPGAHPPIARPCDKSDLKYRICPSLG